MKIESKQQGLKAGKFKPLFNMLAAGSRSEIKEAKKQIEKLWHADSKLLKKAGDFILEIIKDFDGIKDGEHKAAVISGMNLFVLALMDKYFQELSNFILKNIEYPDGRVREAARHISSWLRFKHTESRVIIESDRKKNVNDDMEIKARHDREVYDKFLDKIESLMKKHSPGEKPMYIGDSPSSVYKSVVLLWHDMSLGTPRDFGNREPIMDPMDDEFIPLLGNDDDDEEVDPEEVEKNIWGDKKDGNSEQGEKWLKQLEEISEKRFESELTRLKFNGTECSGIMATVRVYGQEAGPHILKDLLFKGQSRGTILQFSDANNLVREMQSFANHRVIENGNGCVSRLLVEAIVERECSYSGKPDDLAEFVKLICQSHKAIDEFFNIYESGEEQRFLDMLAFEERMRRIVKDENKNEKDFAAEYEEREKERRWERYLGRSVAHHTLDWYIQADPGGFNRINDPRKAASYILIMVRDYNAEITDGEVILSYDNKEVSKFGGWKSAGAFSAVDYKVVRPVLEIVGDPDLLLIDPNKTKNKSVAGKIFGSPDQSPSSKFQNGAYNEIMTLEKIVEKRKEIELELIDMLKEADSSSSQLRQGYDGHSKVMERARSNFTLQDVKDLIYNEEGNDDFYKLIEMFDTGRGVAELQNVFEVVNDAWNYFPHKIIGGLSPAEKLLEYREKRD